MSSDLTNYSTKCTVLTIIPLGGGGGGGGDQMCQPALPQHESNRESLWVKVLNAKYSYEEATIWFTHTVMKAIQLAVHKSKNLLKSQWGARPVHCKKYRTGGIPITGREPIVKAIRRKTTYPKSERILLWSGFSVASISGGKGFFVPTVRSTSGAVVKGISYLLAVKYSVCSPRNLAVVNQRAMCAAEETLQRFRKADLVYQMTTPNISKKKLQGILLLHNFTGVTIVHVIQQ